MRAVRKRLQQENPLCESCRLVPGERARSVGNGQGRRMMRLCVKCDDLKTAGQKAAAERAAKLRRGESDGRREPTA